MNRYLPAYPVNDPEFNAKYSTLRNAREAASIALKDFAAERVAISTDRYSSEEGKQKLLRDKTRELLAREPRFAPSIADAENEIVAIQGKLFGGLGKSDPSDA